MFRFDVVPASRHKLLPMFRRLALVLCCTALCAAAGARASEHGTTSRYLRLSTYSSSGTYGSTIETRYDALSLGFGASAPDWTVEFAVPYLRRRSGFAMPVGGDFASVEGFVPDRTSGWGDAYVSLTRLSLARAAGADIDLQGAVKLATGNVERGLSTGKQDYIVAAEARRYVGTVYSALWLGYTLAGKPPAVGLRNHWSSRLRLSWYANDDLIIGMALHAGRPLTAIGPPRRDIGLNADLRLHGRTRFEVYAHKGLADGSPDRAFGARISVGF